ncbi:MAG: VOC family protein [Candidatus Poribacteria bacterium]|nr:VOC family protein [Candidatus Poribacteria bacterium]
MSEINASHFNHVAIYVSDLRRSAEWYKEHLGMTERSASGNHIFLKLSSGEVLALFQADEPKQVGVGVHHLAFNLSELDEERALETLRKKGIPLERRGPSLSFQDPDGYWLHFS